MYTTLCHPHLKHPFSLGPCELQVDVRDFLKMFLVYMSLVSFRFDKTLSPAALAEGFD